MKAVVVNPAKTNRTGEQEILKAGGGNRRTFVTSRTPVARAGRPTF
jgi:hypothetical protein